MGKKKRGILRVFAGFLSVSRHFLPGVFPVERDRCRRGSKKPAAGTALFTGNAKNFKISLAFVRVSVYNKPVLSGHRYIRPWRSWISQWIPIPKAGGSNPSGRAKQKRHHIRGVSFALWGRRVSRTPREFSTAGTGGGKSRRGKENLTDFKATALNVENSSGRAKQKRHHRRGVSFALKICPFATQKLSSIKDMPAA